MKAGNRVLVAGLLAAGLAGPGSASDGFRFADTPAGHAAAAYIEAFNSGDDDQMAAFLQAYRTQSYLESRPMAAHIDHYHRLQGIFGTLTPLRVALSLDLQVTLVAEGSSVDGALILRFQVDEAPTHKLVLLTTSGVDHAQLPDEEVVRVADRAQPMDAPGIEETARAVARILDQQYVDPALGKAMADTILTHLSNGRYAGARTAGRLADALTEDAVAVSEDRHIWVEATNPLRVQSTYAENLPVEELRRENYHFRTVEVLPGNVGYLKFDMIHDDPEAVDIAARAMAAVQDCDALIFDLRDNIGGEWESARLMLSYVLPESTVISRMYDRDGRLLRTLTTLGEIRGARFPATVPVYVLTSDRTGSAAEGFAYALQQSGRATVVGQTTLGMAHPSEEVTVSSRFLMSVPVYRVQSAFTDKSFQGVGVVPDIAVPEQDALDAALKALKKRGVN